MSLAWLEAETAGTPGAEPVLLEAGDHDSAADAVCDWARQAGVDLLVAAAHRGAIERALSLVGSFSQHLAHHAPCPVLLVPPRPHPDQGTAG
jgi:nucleotide-binding universal stress UspA family protein